MLRDAAEPAEWAAFLFQLGMARRSGGHWDSAIDAWHQALDAYEVVGDEEPVGRLCVAASYTLSWAARFVEAVEIARRGLGALGERVSADRARLLGMAGVPVAYGGHYQSSKEMIDEALALAAELGDDALLGHGLMCKAMAGDAFIEYRETVDAGLRAAELLRRAGDLWSVTSVLGWVINALRYLGRLDEASRIVEDLEPLAERVGNHPALLMVGRSRGVGEFFVRPDLDRLEAFAGQDRDGWEKVGIRSLTTCSWAWLGLARFLRGDWKGARALFEESVRLELPGAVDGWTLLFECLAYLGERGGALALIEGREHPRPGQPKPSGAVSILLSAVEGLTVLGERDRAADLYPYVVDCWERTGVACPSFIDGRLVERAAGIAAMAGGRWEESEAHFQKALAQAETIPHRPEQAHTRRFYGQMLLERSGRGDVARAGEVLRQAVEDYGRMGMPRHAAMGENLLAAC